MESLVGKRIGIYEIVAEIGRGGMAVVYKARQVNLGRLVALKVLLPHLASDPEIVRRFQREARAAAALRHPNIVTVYDVGQSDGYFYMAMEYIEGESLQAYLRRRGRLPPKEAVNILRQVAAALDEAHRQGIVHRDIKPSNVLIEARTGRCVLTDFGVARVMYGGTRLTQTGSFIGTLYYAAPEQIQGKEVDYRADLYAFGVMAYEMLAGRVPFTGNTASVVYAHVHEQPPLLHRALKEISPQLDNVLQRMMAKNPRARYPSALAFVQALDKALIGPSRAEKTVGKGIGHLHVVVGAGSLFFILVLAILLVSPRGNRNLENHNKDSITSIAPATLVSSSLQSTRLFTRTTIATHAFEATPTPTLIPTLTPTPTLSPTSTTTPSPTWTPSSTPTPVSVSACMGVHPLNRSLLLRTEFGDITFALEKAEITEELQFKLYVSWIFAPSADGPGELRRKNSPKEIWLTDNMGNKYVPVDYGGIFQEEFTILQAHKKASGWVLFPQTAPGAYRFTYHGDDGAYVRFTVNCLRGQ